MSDAARPVGVLDAQRGVRPPKRGTPLTSLPSAPIYRVVIYTIPEAEMHTAIQGWSGQGFLARLGIVVLTGVTWLAYGVQKVLLQPEYVNPVTAADYFTVYAYSASLLLTAASLLMLRDVVRPLLPRASTILVVAVACGVAGIANGLEDGLGLRGFGLPYVIGVMVGAGGMLVTALAFWASPARPLTFVPAVGGLAMTTVSLGGGVLGLVAWLGFGANLIRERSRPRLGPVRPDAGETPAP